MSDKKEDGELHYASIKGSNNLVEVSLIENGKKMSVVFDTFSEEQFEMFERIDKELSVEQAADGNFARFIP